jgi:hypothetical protein
MYITTPLNQDSATNNSCPACPSCQETPAPVCPACPACQECQACQECPSLDKQTPVQSCPVCESASPIFSTECPVAIESVKTENTSTCPPCQLIQAPVAQPIIPWQAEISFLGLVFLGIFVASSLLNVLRFRHHHTHHRKMISRYLLIISWVSLVVAILYIIRFEYHAPLNGNLPGLWFRLSWLPDFSHPLFRYFE